jgi:hypothetical protein
MKIVFKITTRLLRDLKVQLTRPHAFAAERVGFLLCRVGLLDNAGLVVLAHSLHDVADEDYLDAPTVGAMMGPDAIRKALQIAYQQQASMFHVHLHLHDGRPRFSGIDEREMAKFVPDFWNVQPDLPHGAIVFSDDSACGRCWIPGDVPADISQFRTVGIPSMKI